MKNVRYLVRAFNVGIFSTLIRFQPRFLTSPRRHELINDFHPSSFPSLFIHGLHLDSAPRDFRQRYSLDSNTRGIRVGESAK